MKINGYLNSVLSLTVLLMINESAWASDEFYQWNLENDGTTIQRDFYDIHSVLLRGKLDFDATGHYHRPDVFEFSYKG